MSGIVYILTNEAMEGLIKIGKTNTSVEQRIKELDNTSLPLPFQCFYAGEVHDANLGSGLIDHSQNITVAAMQMADMKVCAHLS